LYVYTSDLVPLCHYTTAFNATTLLDAIPFSITSSTTFAATRTYSVYTTALASFSKKEGWREKGTKG